MFSWNSLEEQPIKKTLPKKFMHHHNDLDYATMRSTETNEEKITPKDNLDAILGSDSRILIHVPG